MALNLASEIPMPTLSAIGPILGEASTSSATLVDHSGYSTSSSSTSFNPNLSIQEEYARHLKYFFKIQSSNSTLNKYSYLETYLNDVENADRRQRSSQGKIIDLPASNSPEILIQGFGPISAGSPETTEFTLTSLSAPYASFNCGSPFSARLEGQGNQVFPFHISLGLNPQILSSSQVEIFLTMRMSDPYFRNPSPTDSKEVRLLLDQPVSQFLFDPSGVSGQFLPNHGSFHKLGVQITQIFREAGIQPDSFEIPRLVEAFKQAMLDALPKAQPRVVKVHSGTMPFSPVPVDSSGKSTGPSSPESGSPVQLELTF